MIPKENVTRRKFVQGAAAMGGALFADPLFAHAARAGSRDRMRVALVGTGVRGVGMYGRTLLAGWGGHVELVGVCDTNPGRLRYAHGYIGADCPSFVRLEEMLERTRPEWLIVTTWDRTHHDCIATGMQHGANIIVEKPITIDEAKAQTILDAQRTYGKEVVVTHNYRYPPHRAKLKELLMQGAIGDITSVDFHWNITQSHLQQYMRRWHGRVANSGGLWVHKSSHHFDMINWYLDSEPVEVFAFGDLERYGAKGPFRGPNCRTCAHKSACPAYWDIARSEHMMKLYVENEHHDGYVRDGCVFREEIDIHDKHAAMVRYANNAYLNYSLTADTDWEGFWIAFNGTRGRIEGRELNWPRDKPYHDWVVSVRGEEPKVVRTSFAEGGQPTSNHWGGDPLMLDMIFKDRRAHDPLHQSADARQGIMAVLTGVAARKSTESGTPVRIADLTELVPQARRFRVP